jgi:arsenate reductase
MSLDQGTTLLHNPGCSKSRTAHALLTERGVDFHVREYLSEPLVRAELEELHALLGLDPMEWTRTGESEWTQSGLDGDAGVSEILDAMAAAPRLMQRPILIHSGSARVGRPPERLLELLDE